LINPQNPPIGGLGISFYLIAPHMGGWGVETEEVKAGQ